MYNEAPRFTPIIVDIQTEWPEPAETAAQKETFLRQCVAWIIQKLSEDPNQALNLSELPKAAAKAIKGGNRPFLEDAQPMMVSNDFERGIQTLVQVKLGI